MFCFHETAHSCTGGVGLGLSGADRASLGGGGATWRRGPNPNCQTRTSFPPTAGRKGERGSPPLLRARSRSRGRPVSAAMPLAMVSSIRPAPLAPRLAARRSRPSVSAGRRAHVVVAVRASASLRMMDAATVASVSVDVPKTDA